MSTHFTTVSGLNSTRIWPKPARALVVSCVNFAARTARASFSPREILGGWFSLRCRMRTCCRSKRSSRSIVDPLSSTRDRPVFSGSRSFPARETLDTDLKVEEAAPARHNRRLGQVVVRQLIGAPFHNRRLPASDTRVRNGAASRYSGSGSGSTKTAPPAALHTRADTPPRTSPSATAVR